MEKVKLTPKEIAARTRQRRFELAVAEGWTCAQCNRPASELDAEGWRGSHCAAQGPGAWTCSDKCCNRRGYFLHQSEQHTDDQIKTDLALLKRRHALVHGGGGGDS